MDMLRAYEILAKLIKIHEDNPKLAMTDITNEEIREALEKGAEALTALSAMGDFRTYPTMTIASADAEIGNLIEKHSVYGAETVVNALVRGCGKKKWLQPPDLVRLLIRAIRREDERKEENA